MSSHLTMITLVWFVVLQVFFLPIIITAQCLPLLSTKQKACSQLAESWRSGECQVYNIRSYDTPLIWLPRRCFQLNVGQCFVNGDCSAALCQRVCRRLTDCRWTTTQGCKDSRTSPTNRPNSPSFLPSQQPSTSKPFAQSPTRSPSSYSPTIKQSSTKSPLTIPSSSSRPTSNRPSTKNPTSRNPTSKSPISRQPTLTSPTSHQPTSNSPTTASPSSKAPTRPSKPPTVRTNFLFLLADDLGYGDVSFLGGFKQTKNLNDLSTSPHTMMFTNFHSASSTCSPSRAALLSGQYPDRNCVSGANTVNQWPARITMPSIAWDVKKAGYISAFFGKFHLGAFDKGNHPGSFGFDYWSATESNIPTFDPGCFCTQTLCATYTKSSTCIKNSLCHWDSHVSKCNAKNLASCELGFYPQDFFVTHTPRLWCGLKNGTLSEKSNRISNIPQRKSMVCDSLVSSFEDFLEILPGDTPFFVEIGFYEPHYPFIADPSQRKECETPATAHNCIATNTSSNVILKANSGLSNYVSAIISLDKAIGRIHSILRKYSRDENTFLVFCSDNGPEDLGYLGQGTAAPLRGRKRSVFEGGTRVPAFFQHPKYIRNNVQIDSLISTLDLRPTIQDILKQESGIDDFVFSESNDGESLLSLLMESSWNRNKPLVICKPLIGGDKSPQDVCIAFAYYEEDFKKIMIDPKAYPTNYYFDLKTDKGEQTNLALKPNDDFKDLYIRGQQAVDDIKADNLRYCH